MKTTLGFNSCKNSTIWMKKLNRRLKSAVTLSAMMKQNKYTKTLIEKI